ncbi:MAG TPA: alpha/beta hydrolase [Gemmatimonadota bacterium]|nr:alpha/beta hydrolase [Gemmatimonadota bacterium]
MTVCRVANRPRTGFEIAVFAFVALLTAATASAQAPRVFYETDGAGTPVVLVPDWAHDTGSWFWLLPLLREEGRRLIRYDLRGQGRSEIPADGDYSLAAHRADLLRLLDGLGIERAHLVGTGLGASIVLGFTLEHPERVLSVAAVDPRLVWSVPDRESWERLLAAWERIGRPTLGEYTSVLVERWVGTEFVVRNGWVFPWYDLMLRRQSATALIASMRAWLGETVELGEAPPSAPPTLVVVGEGGASGPEGDALGAAFPRAWRERLDESRSQPALDAPEELAERLEEFLDRASP